MSHFMLRAKPPLFRSKETKHSLDKLGFIDVGVESISFLRKGLVRKISLHFQRKDWGDPVSIQKNSGPNKIKLAIGLKYSKENSTNVNNLF